jgi:hypothetical protein
MYSMLSADAIGTCVQLMFYFAAALMAFISCFAIGRG